MTVIESIILGLIQGISEFLPISSSGHLVLAEEVFHVAPNTGGSSVAVNVLMHLGSLLAIMIVFRKDIIALFLPRPDPRKIGLLLLASIPAALVGFLAKGWLEGLGFFSSVPVVLAGLMVTTGLLLLAERKHPENLTWDTPVDAESDDSQGRGLAPWHCFLLIGAAQAFALTPGISRSGATIATALILHWVRNDAVRVSFLMGMIAIGGAGLLEAPHIADIEAGPALAGFTSSLVFSLVGLAGVKLVVEKRKLRWFAAYTGLISIGGWAWLLVAYGP